jgi:hypothetical protein
MKITAKIKVTGKTEAGEYTTLHFQPDYQDDRNKEWALATPSLSLAMNVKAAVGDHFDQGEAYTLTFEKSVDE